MLRIIQNHINAMMIFGNNPRIYTDSVEHHPAPSHFPFLSVTPAPPLLTLSLPFCHPRPIPSFQDCSLRTKHDGRPSCSAYSGNIQLQTFIVDRQPPSDDSRSAVSGTQGPSKISMVSRLLFSVDDEIWEPGKSRFWIAKMCKFISPQIHFYDIGFQHRRSKP